jgi:hypothetical protein
MRKHTIAVFNVRQPLEKQLHTKESRHPPSARDLTAFFETLAEAPNHGTRSCK